MSFETGYALVIGVGRYAHISQADIPISVDDAVAIEGLLRDPTLCGYPPDQVTMLHNETASREGILAALDALAQAADAESTVLLYYCGHGDYDTEKHYCLTAHDTRLEGSKIEVGSGIREVELLDKLRRIRAQKLLLLLNACHSGEVQPSLDLEAGTPCAFGSHSLPPPPAEAILSTGRGRILITACRPQQKSWIGGGRLSIFTQALVEGLSGRGVSSNGGYVSAFALYEHTYARVKEAAGKLGHLQEPELSVLKGVGPFPVALYRGARERGAFDAAESLPKETAAKVVMPQRSQRHLRQYERLIIAANEVNVINVEGPHSAAAIGERATATAVHVEGDVNISGLLGQLFQKCHRKENDHEEQDGP